MLIHLRRNSSLHDPATNSGASTRPRESFVGAHPGHQSLVELGNPVTQLLQGSDWRPHGHCKRKAGNVNPTSRGFAAEWQQDGRNQTSDLPKIVRLGFSQLSEMATCIQHGIDGHVAFVETNSYRQAGKRKRNVRVKMSALVEVHHIVLLGILIVRERIFRIFFEFVCTLRLKGIDHIGLLLPGCLAQADARYTSYTTSQLVQLNVRTTNQPP